MEMIIALLGVGLFILGVCFIFSFDDTGELGYIMLGLFFIFFGVFCIDSVFQKQSKEEVKINEQGRYYILEEKVDTIFLNKQL